MGKDDWYFIIGTIIGIAGLLGVPWREIFGKAKAAMRNPKRELFMVLALLASLAMSSFGWYEARHSKPNQLILNISAYDPPYPAPLRVISDQTFEDQDVPLDGHIYENCTFKNICFMYDGGAYGIHNSTIKGNWKVCVKESTLKNYMALLEATYAFADHGKTTHRTMVKP